MNVEILADSLVSYLPRDKAIALASELVSDLGGRAGVDITSEIRNRVRPMGLGMARTRDIVLVLAKTWQSIRAARAA